VGCESFFLDRDRRLVDLGGQVAEAGERLLRLYASIEAGTIDGTDPMLKERVAALKATRDRALEALDYARKSSALPIEVDPVAVDRFTRLMREQLVSGDVAPERPISARSWMRSSCPTLPSASSARTIISGPP
jgi:site-specific DNA recombinase